MNASPSRKFFDIAPPGKAAPSPTSKPVITGNRPQAQDPVLYQSPLATAASPAITPAQPPQATEPRPLPKPPAQAVPEPTPAEQPVLDPAALLIQAGDFTPLKASKNRSHHVAVVMMILLLVIVCGATYWLVSSL